METVNKIISDLNEYGIAKSHVTELFNEQYLEYFNNASKFMCEEVFNTPIINDYIKSVTNGEEAPKRWYEQAKTFEFSNYACLKRGLTFDDGDIAKLYTAPTLLKIADGYYGEWCKIRNIMAMLNLPNTKSQPHTGVNRYGSQNWHMDTEDVGHNPKEDKSRKILKVWIYVTDVDKDSGALEYKNLKDEEVMACGKKGTIYFVNTAQYHRGGFLQKGQHRMIIQGCYLNPGAWQLNQSTHLKKLNYVSNGRAMWDLRQDHDYYQSLDERGKFLFSDN